MEEIIKTLREQYFIDLILISVLLVCIVISLKNKKKFKILTYFPIYIASLIIVSILNDLCYSSVLLDILLPFASYTDYLFTLLEMVTFSHFYYQLINNHIVKKSILIINALFTFYFIFMGLSDIEFY